MSSITNSVKKKARLFFAIELSQELRNQLEVLQQSNPVFVGRPVKPHNFHITLQFLGSVEHQLIHDLIDCVEIPGIKPFLGSIEHYAYYPKNEIGCVEVQKGKQRLSALKSHLSRCLANEGLHFAKDKHSFRPHITLYRECQPLGDIQQALNFEFKVEHFCLMESIQNDKGVYYEVLEEWPVYEPSIKEQFFGIKE